MNQLLQGNCKEKLSSIEDNSVDSIVTDPPYGYSFMNKDWDKALVTVETWRECLRVLKPGAFAFVMCAPRQDVHARMVINLQDAGFKVDFTSIFWCYASGFPKAGNIGKMVDKKLGVFDKREKTGIIPPAAGYIRNGRTDEEVWHGNKHSTQEITKPSSHQDKKLDGSYAGFQPKPALEIILVVMKPLEQKNYVEQAMANGKGVTWLDDTRIPFSGNDEQPRIREGKTMSAGIHNEVYGMGIGNVKDKSYFNNQGRFPANVLVSDDALNDGNVTNSSKFSEGTYRNPTTAIYQTGFHKKGGTPYAPNNYGDSGSFSRYFDLDAWQAQFLIVEKAAKSEKNKGLESNNTKKVNDGRTIPPDNAFQRGNTDRKNTHPTVKPITLMSYLVTMGSREGDTILDPFAGSGTTLIAASLLKRNYIGIELNPEFATIAEKRLHYWKNKSFEKLQKLVKQADKEKNKQSMESFL